MLVFMCSIPSAFQGVYQSEKPGNSREFEKTGKYISGNFVNCQGILAICIFLICLLFSAFFLCLLKN
jgi:hypothetical protein